MLKLYDHLSSILAQAVVLFVEQYNCRSLIKELIIEIIETGSEMDSYAQESSSSREFSSFIVEIATQKPEFILPCINLLLHNLNCDVRIFKAFFSLCFHNFVSHYELIAAIFYANLCSHCNVRNNNTRIA